MRRKTGEIWSPPPPLQGCQTAKFGAQSKERKGSNFAAQHSIAMALHPGWAKRLQFENSAIAIWQPCNHPQVRSFLSIELRETRVVDAVVVKYRMYANCCL